MSTEIKLTSHYVKSCIFWSEGCLCNSSSLSTQIGCSGKGNCGYYEYLYPWARYLHKLGKHILSKREGRLEATWIPKDAQATASALRKKTYRKEN